MKLSLSLALAATLGVSSAGPPPVNDPSCPTIDDQNFIDRIMDAHWYWRRIHCAQDLTWDPELAKAAWESASACTNRPQHDRPGSNLSSVGPPPDDYETWLEFSRTVVHGWHEEYSKYPYDNPHWDKPWGHFTQLVWRDTSRIGCAIAHCPSKNEQGGTIDFPGRLYCFYENAGNNIAEGAFKENVWDMVCPDPTHRRDGSEVKI